jgi:hypothetical protein
MIRVVSRLLLGLCRLGTRTPVWKNLPNWRRRDRIRQNSTVVVPSLIELAYRLDSVLDSGEPVCAARGTFMIVNRQDIKKAKVVLYNLLTTHQIYDREEAKIIEAAVKILQGELDRRKEPRFASGGQSESNRRRH